MGDNMKPKYNQLITQLVKATVLATVAIVSSWLFIFIGMIFIPDIGWFIPLDAMINGITVYLMFKFAEKPYLFLCKPLALLCYWCFGGTNAASEAIKDKRYLQEITTKGNTKTLNSRAGAPVPPSKTSMDISTEEPQPSKEDTQTQTQIIYDSDRDNPSSNLQLQIVNASAVSLESVPT